MRYHRFDDCLKLGKRIDEKPYLLPNPEILRADYNAPVKSTMSKDIVGATTPEPRHLNSLDNIRDDLNVFEGKKVMISDDFQIGERLLQCLEELIVKGGGKITYDVYETDIYVCRYREGENYRIASRAGKDVGNLSWLYHIITRNTWTSPLRRLLHYPITREGIPGFKNLKISLSNYAGEARIYLENLILAAGAECTKTLKQDNTHLITAHKNSEKCVAAQEWNLHIVNHLWLEDCYAKWQMKTVSEPRYTHFPQRTNLGEIVGQTRIDRFAIEQHFFPGREGETLPDMQELEPEDGNGPSADKNEVAVPEVEMMDVDQEKEKEKEKAKKSKEVKSKPARSSKTAAAATAATPQTPKESKPAAKKQRLSVQTPYISRLLPDGKEHITTPSTTGSRKSKDAAASRLHELASDISLYEKERRRSGGVIYGGRRKSDEQALVTSARKRSVEPDAAAVTDTEATKKQKKSSHKPPPIVMHLLITGFTRWVGEPKLEDTERVSPILSSPPIMQCVSCKLTLELPSISVNSATSASSLSKTPPNAPISPPRLS